MSCTLWFSYLVTGCTVCTVSRYSVKKIILIIYVILLNISLSVPTLNKNSFGIWKHSVFIQLKLCYYLFHVKYNNREIKHGNASSLPKMNTCFYSTDLRIWSKYSCVNNFSNAVCFI